MVYNFAILANELEEFVSKFKETEESSNNVKCKFNDCILFDNGLNQIGIKIDMYRQEHRFSPATPVFRRFDV